MAPFLLEFNGHRLELGPRTCIMGILNATPDSFSDGGRFNTFETAVEQGIKLVEDGAHILDIGGESSRPFAAPVSEQEELDRVLPVIEALAKRIEVPISIDTVKSAVARAALDAGACIINDISAMEKDPAMAGLAAQRDVPVILMHMKGTPETMQVAPDYGDLMREITDYLAHRADFVMGKGIQRQHIILDPGIGFGKTVEHNLLLIKHLERITALGFPVLMGVSRKSFIHKILSDTHKTRVAPDDERTEAGTLAAVAVSMLNGAHIVRVHDVKRAVAFTRILDSIRNA
jgi:dihydropteroate synthase